MLFATLREALDAVNQSTTVSAVQELDFATGDEVQGLFRSVWDAVDAAFLLRLRTLGVCDLRFGVGWGRELVRQGDEDYRGRSGTVWWNAREALSRVEAAADKKGWPRSLRTWVVGPEGFEEGLVNAHLILQDELLAGFDEHDGVIMLGLLGGRTQKEIAGELGVTQPTVSGRISRRGMWALYHNRRLLLEALR